MGCCELDLYRCENGTLLCMECQLPVRIEKKTGDDSHRCVIHYTCVCGKERFCDCGTRIRVHTKTGDMTIGCDLFS